MNTTVQPEPGQRANLMAHSSGNQPAPELTAIFLDELYRIATQPAPAPE